MIQEIISRLDALSRTRALTLRESLELEQAIRAEQLAAGEVYHRGDWTPEADDFLMERIAEGDSFSQVAELMGRTKNSCCGRFKRIAKRMGVQAR